MNPKEKEIEINDILQINGNLGLNVHNDVHISIGDINNNNNSYVKEKVKEIEVNDFVSENPGKSAKNYSIKSHNKNENYDLYDEFEIGQIKKMDIVTRSSPRKISNKLDKEF